MLKPIDGQQSIAQIHMSEKIQQLQQQHSDMQQRYFALQYDEERKRLKEIVKEAEEPEHLKLRSEERRGKSESEREKERNRPSRSPDDTPAETPENRPVHIVDIKV